VHPTHPTPIGGIGTDQGDQRDHARVGQQSGHLSGAADVLGAVVGGKPEVGVEPVAQVVAVDAGWRRSTRSLSTAAATDDLPEPDRPVSQTVAPTTPSAAHRSSRVISPECQTTLALRSDGASPTA
jgi:hypothetical protein